jgi:hypothetical protein
MLRDPLPPGAGFLNLICSSPIGRKVSSTWSSRNAVCFVAPHVYEDFGGISEPEEHRSRDKKLHGDSGGLTHQSRHKKKLWARANGAITAVEAQKA